VNKSVGFDKKKNIFYSSQKNGKQTISSKTENAFTQSIGQETLQSLQVVVFCKIK
jgi:hypothetical protein